jgi:DNA adenine methylase
MEFYDLEQVALAWKTTKKKLSRWCDLKLIPGSVLTREGWKIPKSATKPTKEAIKESRKHSSLPKPFLKWAGGKTQVMDQLRARFPEGLGQDLKRYAEPFVGSGAVLFDIINHYDVTSFYISDINRELINCYLKIRDKLDDLLTALYKYEKIYQPLSSVERTAYYQEARKRFNTMRVEAADTIELAALLIFLNRTCFNGLYRVNSKGCFNVPVGHYRKPTICDESNLRLVSQVLDKVEIVCGQYSKSFDFIDSNTFVYLDPPYRPLSATAVFNTYFLEVFGDTQQIQLAKFVDSIVDKGAHVLVSNSDPKNTDPNENFFEDLYARHTIERIQAHRVINSVAKSRGVINELLIVGKRSV